MRINHESITALLRSSRGSVALPLYLAIIEYPFISIKLYGEWEACRFSQMPKEAKLKVRQASSSKQFDAHNAALSALATLQEMCSEEGIDPLCDEDLSLISRSEATSAIYTYVRDRMNANVIACGVSAN